jgi:hypothetical protein
LRRGNTFDGKTFGLKGFGSTGKHTNIGARNSSKRGRMTTKEKLAIYVTKH